MSNTDEPSFEFIYAGVNPSTIIKILNEAENQRLPLIINNSLVCQFSSSSGNVIKQYLEETRSIDILTDTELVSSPAEKTLLGILKEENPLLLPDEQLLLNHVIAEAVDRQGRIEEVYEWLREQFQIQTHLIPLFDNSINLRVIKDNNAANIRFYQLTGQLPEKLTVEEAKEKRESGVLYLSGDKKLETLKTHPEAIKYLKTSNPLIMLVTDWITLAILLKINDFKKRLSKAEGLIIYLLAIPELDEQSLERYNEIISAILGPEKTIKDVLLSASENGDYIILQKTYSELLSEAEYGCPIIYDDIINNPESIIEYLNRTAKLNLSLATSDADETGEKDSIIKKTTEIKEDEKHSEMSPEKLEESPEKTKEEKTISTSSEIKKEEEVVNVSPSKHLIPKPTEGKLKPQDTIYEVVKEKEILSSKSDEITNQKQVVPKEQTETKEKEQKTSEENQKIKESVTKKQEKESKEKPEEMITIEEGEIVESKLSKQQEEIDHLLSESLKEEFPDLYELLVTIYLLPSIPKELFNKSKEEVVLLLGEDEGIASLAAQNLLNSMLSIDDQIVRIYMARAYAIISSHRPAVCRQVLTQNTIRIGLSGSKEEKRRLIEILASMARQHLESVVYVLEAFIANFVKTESPLEFERGKSFVNSVTGAEQRLILPIIDIYLSYFDTLPESKLPDLSTTISSFDGATVGIELVTYFTLKRAKVIAQEISKHLQNTSFIALVNKILSAWEEGDVHKISQLSGSILPSKTLEKYERLLIAKKIRKIGNIPIDSLSKSLNKKQDELEALIVDLIVKDELDAKLEMVGDRMFVILNGDKKEKDEKNNPDEEKTN